MGRRTPEITSSIKRMRLMVEHLPAGAVYVENNKLFINAEVEKITGFSQSELRTLDDWFEKIYRERKNDIREMYELHKASFFPELVTMPIYRKDGVQRYVEFSAYLDDKSEVWLMRDITEHKNSEKALVENLTKLHEALKNAEEKHKFIEAIAATMPSILYVYDLAKERAVFINARANELWGYPMKQLLDSSHHLFLEWIHPEDKTERELLLKKIKKLQENEFLESEYRIRNNQGNWLWYSDRITAFKKNRNDNVKIIIVAQDISAKKEALAMLDEERTRVVYSSKMMALGEMAGGIAHEINNPVAIIAGRADQLKEMAQQGKVNPERVIEIMEKIEATSLRISKIIQGLRTFSRNGVDDPLVDSSLDTIIQDTLELCRQRFLNYGVKVIIESAPNLKASCRPVQISQVLLNLLINSFEAIEQAADKWISIHTLHNKDFVEIWVTDSGHGIAPQIQQKIMQPFFTTKAIGKGTGLGLSISKGIIDSHGGEFFLDPSCKNTRFVIRLRAQGAHEKVA